MNVYGVLFRHAGMVEGLRLFPARPWRSSSTLRTVRPRLTNRLMLDPFLRSACARLGIRDEMVGGRAAGRSAGNSPLNEPDGWDEFGRRLEPLRKSLLAYFVRAVSDRSEAEDLVQEVYLRIIQRGPLEHSDRLAGYVFRCADSVLKDRHRRRVVRQADRHVEFDHDVHIDAAVPVDREIIARQTLNATGVIIEQLPEMSRAVFLLRRMDELSFGEIAVRLGMSVSTAEKHMLRATRHLIARTRVGR